MKDSTQRIILTVLAVLTVLAWGFILYVSDKTRQHTDTIYELQLTDSIQKQINTQVIIAVDSLIRYNEHYNEANISNRASSSSTETGHTLRFDDVVPDP